MERVGVACDEGIAEVLRLTGPGKAQEITEAYLPVGHRAGEESAPHTHTQLCLVNVFHYSQRRLYVHASYRSPVANCFLWIAQWGPARIGGWSIGDG
jgi:hypothetical protein